MTLFKKHLNLVFLSWCIRIVSNSNQNGFETFECPFGWIVSGQAGYRSINKVQIIVNQNISYDEQQNSSLTTQPNISYFHSRFFVCIICEPFNVISPNISTTNKIEVCRSKTFILDRSPLLIYRDNMCSKAKIGRKNGNFGNPGIYCEDYQVCAIKVNLSENSLFEAWDSSVPIFCHVDTLKETENKSPFPENPGEIVCPPDAILISIEERYTSCKEINSLCIICARNDFEYSLCSSQNCLKKSYFRNDIVLGSACQVSNMVEGQNTRVKQCLEN